MRTDYSLKKNALLQWIYSNGYTQPRMARELRMNTANFKRKLKEHKPFNEPQLRRLIYFMGAQAAFRVIYFHSFAEREEVKQKVFGKKGNRNGEGKRNKKS